MTITVPGSIPALIKLILAVALAVGMIAGSMHVWTLVHTKDICWAFEADGRKADYDYTKPGCNG